MGPSSSDKRKVSLSLGRGPRSSYAMKDRFNSLGEPLSLLVTTTSVKSSPSSKRVVPESGNPIMRLTVTIFPIMDHQICYTLGISIRWEQFIAPTFVIFMCEKCTNSSSTRRSSYNVKLFVTSAPRYRH